MILLTTQGSIHEAIRAIKIGAFDYLIKGLDNDALLPLLVEANENACLHYELSQYFKAS